MNSMLQSSSGSCSARDRTNEFMTTIRSLQGQQLGRAGGFNQQLAPQDKHGQLGKRQFQLTSLLSVFICYSKKVMKYLVKIHFFNL